MSCHEPDRTAGNAIWALVFIGLGVLILANRPLEQAAWWIACAVVAFAAAGWFLFLLLVRRDT